METSEKGTKFRIMAAEKNLLKTFEYDDNLKVINLTKQVKIPDEVR